MKTKTIFLMLLSFFSLGMLHAQDRTTVTATSSDISDNLDLRAVASIFGDSRDLEDFERRLNDPKTQISNLDLNGDGYVDYLRVIETTERNLHLIVVQAVLEKDVFQDVATINVERNGDNVSVQVVGDVYMYGPNYIYEPVYVTRPVIFGIFWGPVYRPYYSPWYWGYYPTYYTYWRPYPIYRYRNNVHVHINVHNHYNYVTVRNPRAIRLYDGRRQAGYERLNPGRSFTQRTQADNKHQYDVVRNNDRKTGTRSLSGTRNNGTRATTNGTRNQTSAGVQSSSGTRTTTRKSTEFQQSNGTVRQSGGLRTGKAVVKDGTAPTRSTGLQTGRTVERDGNNRVSTRTQKMERPQPARQSTGITTRPAPQRSETAQRTASPARSQAPAVQQAPQRQEPASRPQGNGGNRGGGERRGRG